MGLFTSGGLNSQDKRKYESLIASERKASEEDQADYIAFKRKQEEEQMGLKQRSKNLGGGRTGLMFMGNQRGVA